MSVDEVEHDSTLGVGEFVDVAHEVPGPQERAFARLRVGPDEWMDDGWVVATNSRDEFVLGVAHLFDQPADEPLVVMRDRQCAEELLHHG